jgi:hypothetical protein
MPTLRKLRDTDIFLGEEDEFGADIDNPFDTEGVSAMSNDDDIPQFSCDIDLPDKSLEIENKIFLLQLLDIEGGPQANNQKNRLLAKFTSEHPDRFGVRHSDRYYRTKWLLDRWKRDKNFETTKKEIYAAALKPSSSHTSCSFALQEQEAPPGRNPTAVATPPRKKKTKTTQSTEAAIYSPPPIKKEATVKMAPKFGSPLRIMQSSGSNEKG